METLPWYRQFWPWFLISLPATVVVAGLTTWWIAERHADHLVAEDYYKDGLAINREIDKERAARQLGVSAEIELPRGLFRVVLRGEARPAALQLFLSHPMDANRDLSLRLARTAPGIYEARRAPDIEHRWHWRIEPLGTGAEKPWRVDGEMTIDPTDER